MPIEDIFENVEPRFSPTDRPSIIVGRYERNGSKKDSGYFFDIKHEGTTLVRFDENTDKAPFLEMLARQIKMLGSFEYFYGSREIKNVKERWSISYKRLEFMEMAELEKMIDPSPETLRD